MSEIFGHINKFFLTGTIIEMSNHHNFTLAQGNTEFQIYCAEPIYANMIGTRASVTGVIGEHRKLYATDIHVYDINGKYVSAG